MSVFNEDTRVKIPATIQFLRIGYDYQSLREADIDFNTKIFVNRFKPALEKINGREFTYDEIKMIINDIHAVIKNNDLVSGNGSYTGRTIFVNDAFDLYQRTYACVSSTDKDILEYIYYSMLRVFTQKVGGGTHGSAIPYIVFDDIAKESILYNADIVEKYQNIVIPLQEKIIKNQRENE